MHRSLVASVIGALALGGAAWGQTPGDVEARPADLLVLDHGDVEAGGRAVEGGGVPPGTAADDHEVVSVSHASRSLPVASEAARGPYRYRLGRCRPGC